MSDINVETAASADAATEGQNLNSDTAQAQTPNSDARTDNQEKTLTQSEVNRIVARAEAKAKADALKEIQQKQAEAEMTEAQKEKARADRLEADLAAERRERLLDRITNSEFANLSQEDRMELRDRLRGETEEELREDAKKLARFTIPAKPTAPNLDALNRGQGGGITPQELYERKRAEVGSPL